jgi:PadR family transcriptional regulator, regulatory protein PadR
MGARGQPTAAELLPGTLDMLILQTLTRGQQHGFGIAQSIKASSGEVLEVGESSLYPALQRLLLAGWVTAAWGASENNRRARFYKLTAAGRKRLVAETAEFERVITAIHSVLRTA